MNVLSIKKLKLKLFEPIDNSSIVFFRIAFYAVMAITMIIALTFDEGYHLYVVPKHHFQYIGFTFLEPLSAIGMKLVYYMMLGSAIMIMIGWKYRIATITFFILYTYIFLLEPGYFRNHPYLIALISFLFIFIPANRALSIDAIRNSKIASSIAAYWHLNILKFQLAVVFFFAGIVKMHEGWLSGYILQDFVDVANSKIIDWLITNLVSVQFLSYSAMVFDLTIIPLLIWKRTRVFAFIVSLTFHSMNFLFFDLDNFPYLMLAGTLLFFEPSWPKQFLYKFGILKDKFLQKEETIYYGKHKKVTLILLGTYITIQLFLPLRHHLYPGDYRWTEEGARFSWSMFGRRKSLAEIPRFTLYDRESETIFAIEMFEYLHYANRKSKLMIYDPGMTHQFAWIVAKDLVENQGFSLDQIELRASILVSMNGQTPQYQIDPNFDLLSEKPFTLKHREWITPFIRDADR